VLSKVNTGVIVESIVGMGACFTVPDAMSCFLPRKVYVEAAAIIQISKRLVEMIIKSFLLSIEAS
jgi:hypothetical protein